MSTNNAKRFEDVLAAQYVKLFEAQKYALARDRYAPESLASKMTLGLLTGQANKDGEGIKRTCKQLGIKHTYAAIAAFLAAE